MSASHRDLPGRSELASGTPVTHVTRSVPIAQADTPLDEFASGVLIPLGEHLLPVAQDEKVIGVACMHDALRSTSVPADQLLVRDVMTPWELVIALDANSTIADAASAFATVTVHQMPVLDSGRLIGMVHRDDVTAWQRLHGVPGDQ